MADIQGNLPIGLARIRERFGDRVSFTVVDKTDEIKTIRKDGWEHLDILQQEDDYDHIKQRLANALEHASRTGQISNACYDQANGRDPHGISPDISAWLDRAVASSNRMNVDEEYRKEITKKSW